MPIWKPPGAWSRDGLGDSPNAIVSHYDASCRDGGLCADAYLAPLVRGIPRPPHAVLA